MSKGARRDYDDTLDAIFQTRPGLTLLVIKGRGIVIL
jgi:hypothetical protein